MTCGSMISCWRPDTPVGLRCFAAGRLVFGLAAAAIQGSGIVDAERSRSAQTGLASGAGIPHPCARDCPAEPGGMGGGLAVPGVAYPDARQLPHAQTAFWTGAPSSGAFVTRLRLFLGGLQATHARLGVARLTVILVLVVGIFLGVGALRDTNDRKAARAVASVHGDGACLAAVLELPGLRCMLMQPCCQQER
jgi:hypothetical protein